MSKRGSILSDEAELSDINISPMIDMVFILLIFFIVTTVFVEEPGVEVNRQYAQQFRQLQKQSLLFAVTSSDTIVYGGREIGINGVRTTIRRFLLQDPQTPVILQVDRDSSAGLVIRAIDEAKLAGVEVVSISTAKSN